MPKLLWVALPLLVLGFLAASGGLSQFFAVTLTIWLLGGLGTWFIGASGVHVGASGVIFGYLTFLLVRGFFVRSVGQILLAVAVFVVYGARAVASSAQQGSLVIKSVVFPEWWLYAPVPVCFAYWIR